MKTNKLLFFIFLSLLFFLTNCKKKGNTNSKLTESSQIVTTTRVKIKTRTTYESGNILVKTYFYDSLGRLNRTSLTNGFYSTLEWTKNQIISKTYTSQNTLGSIETYDLDSLGRAVRYNHGTYNIVYEYDNNGYLKKTTTTAPGSTLTLSYIILDGNTVMQSTTTGSDKYTYYPNTSNTIGYANIGFNVFGKDDENLIQSVHTTASDASEHYTYQFDSENRVIKKTTTFSTGSSVINYSYYD